MRLRVTQGTSSTPFGRGTRVDPSAIVDDSTLEEHVAIETGCVLSHSIVRSYARLGRYCQLADTDFGDYSYASYAALCDRARIGKFVSIGPYVHVGAARHPVDWVTTHPFVYSAVFGRFLPDSQSGLREIEGTHVVTIGNDVWIGSKATILPGVTIANGAVVGANSVVTKDIGPYEIVAGVPAVVLRRRFDDETIDQLLNIRWWNWSRQMLLERIGHFRDTQEFVRRYAP